MAQELFSYSAHSVEIIYDNLFIIGNDKYKLVIQYVIVIN